jgi:hypothetical protein
LGNRWVSIVCQLTTTCENNNHRFAATSTTTIFKNPPRLEMASNDTNTQSMSNLTDQQRDEIKCDLLAQSNNGVLARGALSTLAKKHERDRSTIYRIWKRYSQARTEGVVDGNCHSKMKGRVGRKRKDRSEIIDAIRVVPIADRTTKTRLAASAGTSRRILSSLMKDNSLRRVTETIRPQLSEENKIQRVQFVLAHLNEERMEFDAGFDVVHVDEKWFNADKDKRVYFLLEGEEAPQRRRQSKRFIEKTMFLAAVTRPR